MIRSIKKISERIGIREKAEPVKREGQRANPEPSLIGAMLITGDRFDPNLEKICLDIFSKH